MRANEEVSPGSGGHALAEAVENGFMVAFLEEFFFVRVLQHDKRPGLEVLAARGLGAGFQDFANRFQGNWIGFEATHRPHGVHGLKNAHFVSHGVVLLSKG